MPVGVVNCGSSKSGVLGEDGPKGKEIRGINRRFLTFSWRRSFLQVVSKMNWSEDGLPEGGIESNLPPGLGAGCLPPSPWLCGASVALPKS